MGEHNLYEMNQSLIGDNMNMSGIIVKITGINGRVRRMQIL